MSDDIPAAGDHAGTGRKASDLFFDYFDRCERSLRERAKSAGIHDHKTLIGTVREKLFSEQLRAILPPSVTIGSGEVIAHDGKKSKQQDVVIFDSRYPRIESAEGVSLFPIEGVIATIEIKSKLTRESLRDSLENSLTMLELEQKLHSGNVNNEITRLAPHVGGELAARQSIFALLAPRTYVYALSGQLDPSFLREELYEWMRPVQKSDSVEARLPPSLIMGGPSIIVSLVDAVAAGINVTHPQMDHVGAKPIAIRCATDYHLGILAGHLTKLLQIRFHSDWPNSLRKSFEHYVSLGAAMERYVGSSPCDIIAFGPKPADAGKSMLAGAQFEIIDIARDEFEPS